MFRRRSRVSTTPKAGRRRGGHEPGGSRPKAKEDVSRLMDAWAGL
jgi:hypothetical protein